MFDDEMEIIFKIMEKIIKKSTEKAEKQTLSELSESNIAKYILLLESAEKAEKQTLSEFKQGHRKKIFTKSQIMEIKKLYYEGFSKNKIAKIFHCSEKTIRNYLKREA